MIDDIKEIEKLFNIDKSTLTAEEIRVKYLSKKGVLTSLLKRISEVPVEDRKQFGISGNELKNKIDDFIKGASENIHIKKPANIDLTLPGRKLNFGNLHPLTIVLNDIKRFFKRYGFSVADGPEIETDFYNFEALNIPQDHPARDMHDTLFTNVEKLLRSHTSNVQIRKMEKNSPPIRVIAPGRVYRKDTPDATHSPVFHQVEGLVVDEGVSFADLKGIIESFAEFMFGGGVKVRFRPSYFPFTEPSFEYDFNCPFCKGNGCRVCKFTGWIEISGAGMVDPNVFGFVNIDSEKYTGYAFGMGLERIAMIRHQVKDIRAFYENDLRFLKQFS